MRIGWIGLGKLGLPMARHAARAGTLRGHDRDMARLAGEPGIGPAESAAALAGWADILLLSLPDDGALRAVAAELAPRLGPETVVVDTSTVSPRACDAVRALLGDRYLAAPVSGSTATAEAAALTLFCSGPEAALARARPVLETFSRAIHHLGPGAEARWMKLAVNHFVGTTAQVAAEALTLARRGGVDWGRALDVLGASVAASPLVGYKLAPLRARDFAPAFSVAQMEKDMRLVAEAAAAAGTPGRLAALVHGLYRDQAATDLAALDFFAAILAAERAAGLPEP
ncbi:NAD(P)-dependent oxidoreductase [Roseomonas sp. NAR14]|uniref:NAD(P)-dependent oxidoreductase n=1 Tax=Roseomonas acroporae TaxID=2937791 RepID=A0A9X1YDI1_9PROT|nr:NAD(P)-dependent oxidoreductase [Roseomonas acroporae]MCK8787010.1 NAD(P)-dependent oxidoreductase [Roseomonas acroporae]